MEIQRVRRKDQFDWVSVTYDLVLGVIFVEVNTADEHGSIGGGGGDDDLLGTTLQVGRSPVDG